MADYNRRNIKTELLNHCSGRVMLCCYIESTPYHFDDDNWRHILPTGYTQEDLDIFLTNIDFEYDSGYGGQEVYGIIWYKDGTWSTRGEYDGSEWWEYHILPEIPKDLDRKDKVREEKLNQIL